MRLLIKYVFRVIKFLFASYVETSIASCQDYRMAEIGRDHKLVILSNLPAKAGSS